MAAVGLSDVFKYGTRFLAHLLVVVLAGVVLVLIGNVVGEFLIGTPSDPSFRTPPETIGWAGVAISAVGVLATVAGLGGLLFKIVADGTAAGTRAVATQQGVTAATTVADEAPDQSGGPGVASPPTPDTSTEPTKASGQPTHDDQPQQDSQPEPVGQTGSQPRETTDDPTTQVPSEGSTIADTESQSDSTPPSEQPTPATQGPADTESSPPEQTEPIGDPETLPDDDESTVAESSETASVGSAEGEPSESRTDEPPEWTPPDPEEFERHQQARADERRSQGSASEQQADRTASDSPTDDSAPYEDETRVVDEEQFDEPADAATSWDDLTGSSGTSDADSTGGAGESQTDEWSDPNQFEASTETDSRADETAAETDSDNGYAMDEETDETESFSFESGEDNDPLSDALNDE